MFCVAAFLALSSWRVPYYEYHPGSARATAPLIDVQGAETYPPSRAIAYTTISLRPSTALSWIFANFDDDVTIRTEEEVLGSRSAAENREANLQLMDTSKQDAVRSALVTLGYDVPVSIDGQFVVGVTPGSNAHGVLEVGDVIVAVDGELLTEPDIVGSLMEGRGPGESVELTVEHPTGETEDLTIELVAADEDEDRGIIGVLLQPRGSKYDFPFTVDIDSGSVGGPSAGLAFSLGVLDVLTPGDLTGPHDVAVTGTIDANGNVGVVGGVPQKTSAAIAGGADVFLVPSGEVDEATDRAGDALQVIGVDTLQEALEALASLGGSGLPSRTE